MMRPVTTQNISDTDSTRPSMTECLECLPSRNPEKGKFRAMKCSRLTDSPIHLHNGVEFFNPNSINRLFESFPPASPSLK